MFYHFIYPLKEIISVFNVFKYVTFRAGASAVTSFLICIVFGPFIIRKLTALKMRENIRRKECPEFYDMQPEKQGTATMGGLLIIFSIVTSVLLWADLANQYILISLLSGLWLGMLGFRDDYLKLTRVNAQGLSAKTKLFWQILLGLLIGVILLSGGEFSTAIDIPFLKKLIIDLGVFYILFILLVVVATSNAVNITDGLDGLAIGSVVMVAACYCLLSYITGHAVFSNYLFMPHIPQATELTVFCAAILGASLGFLWFNAHPANIFMGDTGSLALGGMIGTVAILTKKELLLGLVGIIFVIEAFSVILQVAHFKLTGRRIFKMAPLHHHFQKMGQKESKIIIRFWIIGIIFLILTLVTLKLR